MARYLVMMTASLGDVATALGTVYAVARANPHDRFVLMLKPSITGVVAWPPHNVEAMTIDLRHGDQHWGRLLRLARQLRYDLFDGCIDTIGSSYSRFISRYLQLFGHIKRWCIAPPPKAKGKRSWYRLAQSDRPTYRLALRTLFNQAGLLPETMELDEGIVPPISIPAEDISVPRVGLAIHDRFHAREEQEHLLVELMAKLARENAPGLYAILRMNRLQEVSPPKVTAEKKLIYRQTEETLSPHESAGGLSDLFAQYLPADFSHTELATLRLWAEEHILVLPEGSFSTLLSQLSQLTLVVGSDVSLLPLAELVGTPTKDIAYLYGQEKAADEIVNQISPFW